jgi:hypothetical protein
MSIRRNRLNSVLVVGASIAMLGVGGDTALAQQDDPEDRCVFVQTPNTIVAVWGQGGLPGEEKQLSGNSPSDPSSLTGPAPVAIPAPVNPASPATTTSPASPPTTTNPASPPTTTNPAHPASRTATPTNTRGNPANPNRAGNATNPTGPSRPAIPTRQPGAAGVHRGPEGAQGTSAFGC